MEPLENVVEFNNRLRAVFFNTLRSIIESFSIVENNKIMTAYITKETLYIEADDQGVTIYKLINGEDPRPEENREFLGMNRFTDDALKGSKLLVQLSREYSRAHANRDVIDISPYLANGLGDVDSSLSDNSRMKIIWSYHNYCDIRFSRDDGTSISARFPFPMPIDEHQKEAIKAYRLRA